MPVSFQQTFECSICEKEVVVDCGTDLFPACLIVRHDTPPGWTWVEKKLVCPTHVIAVDEEIVRKAAPFNPLKE